MSTPRQNAGIDRRVFIGAGISLLGVVTDLEPIAATSYADQIVTLFVPFAPGGASDLLARVISGPLGQLLGHSVIVENRGGAGGNIGIGAAARAKPDGYTLLVTSSAFVVNPSLYKKVPYDPFKDFDPIVDLGASPNVIVANKDVDVSDIADLIAKARAHPERFNYASPGAGTTPQLSAELLKLRAGIHLTHVSYSGAGPALTAVLGGTTQLAALNLSVAVQHIRASALRALVQTGATRWLDLPDVPTMEEAGFPNAVSETFQALLAPAGTPPPVIEILEQDVIAILQRDDTCDKLKEVGFGVIAKGPLALKARIAREVPMWKEVIAKAELKPQRNTLGYSTPYPISRFFGSWSTNPSMPPCV
jgi:tripartite-type tricarboxylate transporter receptor subunit TctC